MIIEVEKILEKGTRDMFEIPQDSYLLSQTFILYVYMCVYDMYYVNFINIIIHII